MNYLATFLTQILIYQLTGNSAFNVLKKYGVLEKQSSFFLRQLLGTLVFSFLLLGVLFTNLPKSRLTIFVLAFFTITILSLIAKRLPFSKPKKLHFPTMSWGDIGYFVLLVPIALYWLTMALITTGNMVPAGDGWAWVSRAAQWSQQVPLDIINGSFSNRPPMTTLVESTNLIILGKPETNCSLLALWWLNITVLGIISSLMLRLANRWTGLLMLGFLTVSPAFVHNITLGYRDALLAKLVVATILAAIWFAKKTDDSGRSILFGTLFAITALTKDEGLVYACICGFVFLCSLTFANGWRELFRSFKFFIPLLVVILLSVGVWWLIRKTTMETGILGRKTSIEAVWSRLTPARLWTIAIAMWAELTKPAFILAAVSLGILMFRRVTKWPIQIFAVIFTSLGFLTAVYIATPVDVEEHIVTSLPRLIFVPWSLAWCFVLTVCANGLPDRLKNLTAETSAQKPANSK